tara:strand:- start:571 stop:2070 length:1500 start_codon:yes stop_codon:yes gene_type:complete
MPPPRDLRSGQIAFNDWLAKNHAAKNAGKMQAGQPGIFLNNLGGGLKSMFTGKYPEVDMSEEAPYNVINDLASFFMSDASGSSVPTDSVSSGRTRSDIPLSELGFSPRSSTTGGWHTPTDPAAQAQIDRGIRGAEEDAILSDIDSRVANQFDMGKAYRDYDLISGNYGGANPEVISSVDPSVFNPPSFSSPIDQEGSIQARGATAGASEAASAASQQAAQNADGKASGFNMEEAYNEYDAIMGGMWPGYFQAPETDYGIDTSIYGSLNDRLGIGPIHIGSNPEGDYGWNTGLGASDWSTGFTPDTVAEGPHEDEPTYAYDPVPGRNLGILDASKGSFYDAYTAEQTVPSRIMSAAGPQIAMGTAIPNMFTAAKGVGKWLGGDKKTRGGSFLPSFSNIGRVSQGDRFANLMAAQHYADQGPEGWVQSDFVGNYNPLEGRTGYGNRMGSINQEEAHTQEGIDRAGGYDIGATIGDYLGGIFSGEENNDEGNENGRGFLGLW